jgi:hypothetical protein
MSKPKVTLLKPSKADIDEEIRRRFRYMSPEHIAEDFKSPRERAAIRAVFRWLSLNGLCAWELKRRNVYTTAAMFKRVRRDGPYQAVVVPVEAIRRAEALLNPSDTD